MKLPISNRLLTCAGFVYPGDRVADIGCDHGYLGIHLLLNGIAQSVIASDINEGPLHSALINAEKYGVKDRMTFCLSNGVRNIPRDFDTMICAGMGGDTMVHILEDAPWLRNSQYRLILQCQSKTPMLRKYLSQQGWRICEESCLRDGRFLYTVMEVCWQPDCQPLTTGEWYFPPALLENPGEALPAYYRWVVDGLQLTLRHQQDEEKQQALTELLELVKDPALTWLKEERK